MTGDLLALVLMPGGLFVVVSGLACEWLDRKLVARFQNRIGPRWFQPLADLVKLFGKQEIVPHGTTEVTLVMLPIVALASVLTAALYVPIGGLRPAAGFQGDLIVTIYLLSVLTLCLGLAGSTTRDRFANAGASRTLTQLFAYEAPWLAALLGPALAASTWQVGEVADYASSHWLIFSQPVGFGIALLGLVGKLELCPFDAPEADTELVAGALTEYSGGALALFRLARNAAMVVGLSLIAAFFLGGSTGLLPWATKTVALLCVVALIQSLFARLRIDQTTGLWWRVGAAAAVVQLLMVRLAQGVVV